MDFSSTPFPILETERLILRAVKDSDVDQIIKLRGNPKTMYFIPRPLVKTEEDAMEHIKMIRDTIAEGTGINWAITLKENNTYLGFIGVFRIQDQHFKGELGYMLLPEYHGKGINNEAGKAVLNFAFNTLNLNAIEAVINPQNTASLKSAKSMGFTEIGTFPEYEYYNGKFLDCTYLYLLKKDFNSAT